MALISYYLPFAALFTDFEQADWKKPALAADGGGSLQPLQIQITNYYLNT